MIDFQTVYHLSFQDVGYSIGYTEARILFEGLKHRTDTLTAMKAFGYERPFNSLLPDIAALYELQEMRTRGKKGKPFKYPVPYKTKSKLEEKFGRPSGKVLPVEQMKKIFARKKRREITNEEFDR